jgi:hypothetical protein
MYFQSYTYVQTHKIKLYISLGKLNGVNLVQYISGFHCTVDVNGSQTASSENILTFLDFVHHRYSKLLDVSEIKILMSYICRCNCTEFHFTVLEFSCL